MLFVILRFSVLFCFVVLCVHVKVINGSIFYHHAKYVILILVKVKIVLNSRVVT